MSLHTGKPSSATEVLAICISLGHFLFECGWIMLHHEQKPHAMIAHHIVTVIGLSTTLYLGRSGAEVCAVIFGTEITSPLLLLRWFLRDSRCSDVYVLPMELLFMNTFVLFRIFIGTYLIYDGILHPAIHISMKIGVLALYAVSWAFLINIVQVALYHFSKVFRSWMPKVKNSKAQM